MPKFKENDDFVVDLRDKQKLQPPDSSGNIQYSVFNISNFVKYNNAFLVLLVVGVMTFGGLVFASEDVRSATIGSKQVSAQGVDNTLLLEMDLDTFSMDFTIEGIVEDDEQFLVSYSFVDLAFDEEISAWQFVEKIATRKISKPFRRDLGLYLAEQLSQEQKARVKELKKLQTEAREQGETKVVQVSEYSGLIGKVLDLSAAVFEGYEPVKKVELPTPMADTTMLSRTQNGSMDNLTNVYNEWVESNPDLVADLNGGEESESPMDSETEENPPSPNGFGEASKKTLQNGGQAIEQENDNETDSSTSESSEATTETEAAAEGDTTVDTQAVVESEDTQEVTETAETQGPVESEALDNERVE